MDARAELSAFLRSRRARLKPADTRLGTGYGERRRVPGLRREELAQLVGVSVDYYVRFERGRSENVSDGVPDALQLTVAERAHLHNLARAVRPRAVAERAAAQEPSIAQLHLLDAIGGVPAYLVGRRTDVLAWNPLYGELIGVLDTVPPEHRNIARLVFLHEEVRARYVSWDIKARNVVAYLRRDLGRHPRDPGFAPLIEELEDRSPEFRKLWAEYEVADRIVGDYRMRHPVAGELDLRFESFQSSAAPDISLVTYTAEPGSASDAALRRLAAG
jgi:transcriptional regulator with XRE-family HTH domain